ncbi:protease inhibitor I42 family protein, partial [Pseudomonas aeruginosa]
MSFSPSRLLLPLSIVVLAGCAGQQKPVVTLDDADDCSPLKLTQGQELVLTLPSNPTTGFRWELRNPAASVLKRLGPEVYSNSEEDSGLVGSGGESTWRFRGGPPPPPPPGVGVRGPRGKDRGTAGNVLRPLQRGGNT